MELQEEVEEALSEIRATGQLSNYLVRGDSFDHGEVSRADFDQDTTRTVFEDVLKFASRVADSEYVKYDPAYQAGPHQMLIDSLSNLPQLGAAISTALNDDVPLDVSKSGTIRAMIHVLGTAEGAQVSAVRLSGMGIAARRPRGFKALIARDGVYVESSDEVIYYEASFDLLVVGEHVFATKPSTIQQGLGSAERAQAFARTTFKSVTAKLSIKGLDEMEAAATSQPTMVAKMASIARIIENDPDYLDLLTTEKLLAFLDDNPHVDIEIEGEGDERQLVFNPRPAHRFAILKLIADDFLESLLSGRHYEAGSKQQQ